MTTPQPVEPRKAERNLENEGAIGSARLRGFIAVAVGLALAKWQIYDPLHAADMGVRRVVTSRVLLGLAILGPVFGLCLIVFGNKASVWFRDGLQLKDYKSSLRALLIATPCLLLYVYIQRALYAQGYR